MEFNIEQILNFIFITISLYNILQHIFTSFGPIYRLNNADEEVNLAFETIKQSHFYKTLNARDHKSVTMIGGSIYLFNLNVYFK